MDVLRLSLLKAVLKVSPIELTYLVIYGIAHSLFAYASLCGSICSLSLLLDIFMRHSIRYSIFLLLHDSVLW